jgi:succinate-acetate transporter protein
MTETAPEPTPAAEPALDRFATPVPVANAALVGVPTFLVGSIALALVLTGYVPQTLAGAPIAIIAVATGLGQIIATIFALRAGESAVASVFGIFAGFWLSYAALVLGILHNWYGLVPAQTGTAAAAQTAAANAAAANIEDAQKVFLLSWLILIVLLTVVSLRLPLAFTVLFALVDLALLFVFLGVVNTSEGQTKVGGYFAWGFIIVGAYLFLDAMTAATGGKNLPLGKPVLH